MSDNIKVAMEYEARSMLSKSQYEDLVSFLSDKPHQDILNKNIYLDTPEIFLLQHHLMLRIRIINQNQKELTLKIKESTGDLEINEPFIEEKYNGLKEGKILDELVKRDIDINRINVVGELVTERKEYPFDGYLVVLDKNIYNDIIDYNIEVESISKIEAINHLNEIGKKFNISYQKDYISKSRRVVLKH